MYSMNFNPHYDLDGKHAFLSPSTNYWIGYTPERLEEVYFNQKKKEEGVFLHAFASMAIKNRIKLARHKRALNMFVNDAIGFRMESEQVLYYSDNCFGTADAISYEDDVLKIFDLKTGVGKVSFKQLDVYGALFCLEYGVNPMATKFQQRIYQGNDYIEEFASPEDILFVMNKIMEFDKYIEEFKERGGI